jgi:hypothetical protein
VVVVVVVVEVVEVVGVVVEDFVVDDDDIEVGDDDDDIEVNFDDALVSVEDIVAADTVLSVEETAVLYIWNVLEAAALNMISFLPVFEIGKVVLKTFLTLSSILQ